MNILKIFETLSTEFKENFDKYKSDEYTLAKFCTIPFFTKEVGYREVNNWGMEEGTDIYLLFFPEGWKLGKMIVQTGAGINKVIKSDFEPISEEGLVKWFQNQTNTDQMEMIASAYEILKKSGKLYFVDEE